jgi:hypothetical protein
MLHVRQVELYTKGLELRVKGNVFGLIGQQLPTQCLEEEFDHAVNLRGSMFRAYARPLLQCPNPSRPVTSEGKLPQKL